MFYNIITIIGTIIIIVEDLFRRIINKYYYLFLVFYLVLDVLIYL